MLKIRVKKLDLADNPKYLDATLVALNVVDLFNKSKSSVRVEDLMYNISSTHNELTNLSDEDKRGIIKDNDAMIEWE